MGFRRGEFLCAKVNSVNHSVGRGTPTATSLLQESVLLALLLARQPSVLSRGWMKNKTPGCVTAAAERPDSKSYKVKSSIPFG